MSDEKETLNTRKKRVPLKKRLKKIGMKVVMLGAVFLGYKYTKNQERSIISMDYTPFSFIEAYLLRFVQFSLGKHRIYAHMYRL